MPIDRLEDKDVLVSRLQAAAHVAAAYRHVTGSTREAIEECWRELELLLAPINEAIRVRKEFMVNSQTGD